MLSRIKTYMSEWNSIDNQNNAVLDATLQGTLGRSGTGANRAELVGSLDKKTHLPDAWSRTSGFGTSNIQIFELDVDMLPSSDNIKASEDINKTLLLMEQNGCCSVKVLNTTGHELSSDIIVIPAWDFLTVENRYTLYHPQSQKVKIGIKLDAYDVKPGEVLVETIQESKLQYLKLTGTKPPLMTTRVYLDDNPEIRMPQSPYVSCVIKNKKDTFSEYPTPANICLSEPIPEPQFNKSELSGSLRILVAM